AMVLFLVQIGSAASFAPAADIDPAYATALRNAHAVGVEVVSYTTTITPEGIELGRRIPVTLG
ncbi:MAG: DNA/RNA nuclease SfsA, partial [Beijerinckiaceae bacterium]|nr:DNA/RNA nuclease SfsA [Beijerinckiaceae bacterium]